MKTFNPAVALLKIAMCYCVVACHFGGGRCAIAVSVPVFMLIAFYYSHNPAHGGGDRLTRLLVPFWFWGFAGLCVWPFTTKFGYTWKTLVVRFVAQMTLGSSLNSPLYFLFILVLFTICLWLFPKIYCSTKTLCSIVIFSLIFQYTGMNHFICDKFPFGANNVFGRIVEFAPYAAMGICLRRFNLEGKFNPFALCINGVILLFAGIAMSRVSMFQCIGFGYQGVALFFQGIGLFVVAIGFGQVISERFNKPIKYVAALTPGVYYSHRLIGDCLVCVFHDVCCITLLVFMASAVLIALLMQIRVMRKFVC